MVSTDVQLPAATRSNLLTLQVTQQKLASANQRLATGLKVNTALDDPQVYFASKGLTQRANDLQGLKEAIGQGLSTLKAADTGISSIEKLLSQAKGLTIAAQGAMGQDQGSQATRRALAQQFDRTLDAIGGVVGDAGYRGKNLLVGDGLRRAATNESKLDVGTMAGISSPRVTNVKEADRYSIDVLGSGRISADPSNIADAEMQTGLGQIEVGGGAVEGQTNFEDITITVRGGAGRDKAVTVSIPPEEHTQHFTMERWKTAHDAGQPLTFDQSFRSGASVRFKVDFDRIDEKIPATAPVQVSLEKRVDIGIRVTDSTGYSVTRSASSPEGQAKLSGGENAFVFDSGTVRLNVDPARLVPTRLSPAPSPDPLSSPQDYVFLIDVSGSMGGQLASIKANVATFAQNVLNAGVDARFAFVAYSDTAEGEPMTASAFHNDPTDFSNEVQTIGMLGGGDIKESGLEGLLRAADLPFRSAAAKRVIMITDASVHDTEDQRSASTVLGTAFTLAGKGVTVDVAGPSGGDPKLAAIAGGTGGRYFDINDPAFFAGTFGVLPGSPTPLSVGAAGVVSTKTLVTSDIQTANYSNDLIVPLNERNSSQVTVAAQNVSVSGEGLQVDYSQNEWRDAADVDRAMAGLDVATQRLRGAAQALATGTSIITTRESFTKEISDVLVEGANKLTLADQNEEGAKMLMLETRQQLGTTALSLANQSQQSILSLFG